MGCSHFSISSSYNKQKKTSYPHHAKPIVCLSDYAMNATTMTEGSIQLHEQFYCDKKSITPEGSTITTLALGMGARILPRVYILHGKHHPSKIITRHYLRRLVPMRLDGSLVKYS
jgi:hypothetical protein